MMTTVGSKLHELIVETKAKELIELMEGMAPEIRAMVSPAEANEALVDALSSLEGMNTDGLSHEIVVRAKALAMRRSALN